VVAWKIIIMLYQNHAIPEEEYYDFLEFAAIATVCDVMDLRDENRTIVKFGLQQIRQTKNTGLSALLKVQDLLRQEHLTAYHIGFIIGPCINAGGRLRSAELALDLFLTADEEQALMKASKLKELNESRKTMTVEATNKAFEMVEKNYLNQSVLVIYLPELHESLAGIVAGRIREKYSRPAFVITKADGSENGEMLSKGSGRSIDGYSMSEHLQEVSELLVKWGGHPLAAGFTLSEKNIDEFRLRLNKLCNLSPDQLIDKIWIDVPMPIDYISNNLIRDFEKLEPFGKGNEKPCFATKNLRITDFRVLGKNRNVVKMRLQSETGSLMDGLIFTNGDEFLRKKRDFTRIDVVYYPQINEYNGTQSLQIVIDDYQLKP
jgi:single-stranded-DNA-specific exonuclease